MSIVHAGMIPINGLLHTDDDLGTTGSCNLLPLWKTTKIFSLVTVPRSREFQHSVPGHGLLAEMSGPEGRLQSKSQDPGTRKGLDALLATSSS